MTKKFKRNPEKIAMLLEKWKKNPIKSKKTLKTLKATGKALLSGTIGVRTLGSKPLRTGIRLLGKKGVRAAMGGTVLGGLVAPAVITAGAAGLALLKKKCPKGQKYSKIDKKCY